MKKLLILLILPCFIGCYSFQPVSSMSDYQLQHEYKDIQYQIRIKESEYSSMTASQSQRPTSYTATTSGNKTTITPDRDIFSSFTSGRQEGKKRQITKLLSRQRELGMEMHRRGIGSP